jgi:hypothetical protein
MRTPLHLPSRVVAASVLSAALAIGLTACGSSSPSTTSATAASGTSTSSSARYQARLNLAKCLRSHGVNVPDPSPNGGPAGGGGGGGGIFRQARGNPNFQSAMQACAQYRRQANPFSNLSPVQRAQFQQDLVKFAQCMRSHGIDIPDPTTSSGGGFGIFRQIPSSERNSPAFRSAVQACSTNLPFRPGARPGEGATSGA